MHRRTLADYIQSKHCQVAQGVAGHTGGPAPCPKCETYLRNDSIRADVNDILARRKGRGRAGAAKPQQAKSSPSTGRTRTPAPAPLEPGIPLVANGTIWWFDRESEGAVFKIHYWDDDAERSVEWSAGRVLDPPEAIKQGVATARDRPHP